MGGRFCSEPVCRTAQARREPCSPTLVAGRR